MKILSINIIGAGNIGFSLGYLLSEAGYRVVLCGRKKTEEMISNGKIIIKTKNKQKLVLLNRNLIYQAHPQITANSTTIVATKTFDIENCLNEHPEITNSEKVLFLQNGLLPEKIFSQYLKKKNIPFKGEVYGGVIFGTAQLSELNTLEMQLEKIVIGSANSSMYHFGKLNISDVMKLDQITYSHTPAEYLEQRTKKLMYNSTNLLCFLFNITLGQLAESPMICDLFKEKIEEMVKFFNIKTDRLNPEQVYNDCLYLCKNKFHEHWPSIVQDAHKLQFENKPLHTEIDQIDEIIILESTYPMPVSEFLIARTRMMVKEINTSQNKFDTYIKLSNQNRLIHRIS